MPPTNCIHLSLSFPTLVSQCSLVISELTLYLYTLIKSRRKVISEGILNVDYVESSQFIRLYNYNARRGDKVSTW